MNRGRALILAGVLLVATTAAAAEENGDRQVDVFVRQWASHGASVLGPTEYASAFVDLNGDGLDEALVYLTGPDWCGSGGCNLLVLRRAGTAMTLVTNIRVARLPVRVLSAGRHGWSDIAVQVAGGGIQSGYEAVLSFEGEGYPSNPTVSPARRAAPGDHGRTLLTADSPRRRIP